MVKKITTPTQIVEEGTQRFLGRDAQRMNILAGRIVAEIVKTTLGPRGMDKMLVDPMGDVVITNDGVTILEEMDIAHPAAKMLVEVAKTQDDEVGDGTTTAVVLTGELLKNGETLLEQNLHPTIIASGYKIAAEKAEEILNTMATKVNPTDEKILLQAAETAMTGKGAEKAKDILATLAVTAVKQITEKENGGYIVDTDDVKIEKREGGSVEDSQLVQGVIIDKEKVHPAMPRTVKDATIALIDSAIEFHKTETDAAIRITSPEQMQAFIDEEERTIKKMVDEMAEAGVTAVFCQKEIDDLAQHYMAKRGICAVRQVKESDMKRLAKATGAAVVTKISDLSSDDFGYAGLVEERKIGKDNMIFVENCENPKAVSLLLRGGTEHFVDSAERALEDAIGVVATIIKDGTIVAGGGAAEIELGKQLAEFSVKIGGKEQLPIKAFAEAMDVIPRTLAENAGLDPIDILVNLRSSHEKNGKNIGLNIFDGKTEDMMKGGIVEPLRIKSQAVKSSSEAAIMILRIDDVIAASELKGGGLPEEDL
jgi:thermosome